MRKNETAKGIVIDEMHGTWCEVIRWETACGHDVGPSTRICIERIDDQRDDIGAELISQRMGEAQAIGAVSESGEVGRRTSRFLVGDLLFVYDANPRRNPAVFEG